LPISIENSNSFFLPDKAASYLGFQNAFNSGVRIFKALIPLTSFWLKEAKYASAKKLLKTI